MIEGAKDAQVWVDGKAHDRIAYGSETNKAGADAPPKHCPNCGSVVGKLHALACRFQQCPACRVDRTACGCMWDDKSSENMEAEEGHRGEEERLAAALGWLEIDVAKWVKRSPADRTNPHIAILSAMEQIGKLCGRMEIDEAETAIGSAALALIQFCHSNRIDFNRGLVEAWQGIRAEVESKEKNDAWEE